MGVSFHLACNNRIGINCQRYATSQCGPEICSRVVFFKMFNINHMGRKCNRALKVRRLSGWNGIKTRRADGETLSRLLGDVGWTETEQACRGERINGQMLILD